MLNDILWPEHIQYEVSLSQILSNILWPDHIQRQPPNDQTLYRTRPFTEYWEVSIEHLRRVWLADRWRLLLRIRGAVPLGLAYVLLVETNPFSELVVILLFEYPSVLSRFCSEQFISCRVRTNVTLLLRKLRTVQAWIRIPQGFFI